MGSQPLYKVSWCTAQGQWLDLPVCDEPEVAAYLVKALLRATKQVGEVVKVERWVELRQES